MDETPEMIRHQMDETRAQLSEKLESLELQVSETVQSTGTAVNATVEAVQETVESVTSAFQDAAQFVSNALDVRRQAEKHPLLVIGGAFVLGYLAIDFVNGRAKSPAAATEPAQVPSPPANTMPEGNARPGVEAAAATTAALAAAYEAGRESSSWFQLKSLAINALIGIARDVASHATPMILDQLTGRRSDAQLGQSEEGRETPSSRIQSEPSEVPRHLHIASSKSVRSGNAF